MAYQIKVGLKSSVTGNNKTIARNDGTALIDALKASQQFYAASFKKEFSKDTTNLIRSLAKKLNAAVELAIVNELGGGQISASSGGGFYPDYFIEEDGVTKLKEQKLVATEQVDDKIFRRGKVSIGGGAGINIGTGTQSLVTNFITTDTGDVVAQKEEIKTTKFYEDLLANKNNQEALLSIISGSSKAARAIKNTLTQKANTIDIPVQFNGQLQNRSIMFSWRDMAAAVRKGKAKITVKPSGEDAVNLNFYFTGATITKALNDMNKVIIKDLNGTLGKEIQKLLQQQVQLAGPKTVADVNNMLKSLGFTHGLKYLAGSAIISRGTFKINRKDVSDTGSTSIQGFISGAQWTALTQQRLKQTMGHTGEPDAPFLKERSGRFRGSVQVFANYRLNLLRYTYNPLYRSLERYGYTPDLQVAESIRDVANALYTRKFNIVKA